MKAEKINISFVVVIVGLIAAGVDFYLYHMTRTIPPSKTQNLSIKTQFSLTPIPNSENFLTDEPPKDESVSKTNKFYYS